MVKFKTLELQDFMCFGEAHLEFSPGCILVTGANRDNSSTDSNESGKSTLVTEGPIWTLFGKTLRGWKDVERVDGDSLRGYIEGEKRGVPFSIERTSSQLKLEIDGGVIGGGKRDTQDEIERLLGGGFETFVQTSILGQDSLKFSDLTDKGRKEMLEQLTGVTEYDDYRQEGKQWRDEIESQIREVESDLGDVIHQWELKEAELTSVSNSITRCRQDLKQVKDKIEQVEGRREDLKESISGLEPVAQREMPEGDSVDTVNADLRNVERNIVVLEEPDKVCPECKRPYDEGDVNEALRRFYRKQSELEEKRFTLVKQLKAAQEREAAVEEVQVAQQEIKRLSAVLNSIDGLEKLSGRKGKLEGEVEALEGKRKDLETEQKRLAVQESELKQQKGELEAELPYIEFWVDTGYGPRGLKSLVFDGFICDLNNELLPRRAKSLLGRSDGMQLLPTKELRTGGVSNQIVLEVLDTDYKGRSAGMRQRADLCLALAFQDWLRDNSGFRTNLLVLDEVVTHIDSTGADRVLSLLATLEEEGYCVPFVTHNEPLKSHFSRRIHVVREGGVSTIRRVS